MTTEIYRGRFAPTPSGPLHLGSLMTALTGFLQARKAGGKWLLRIDDLDLQRSREAHVEKIQRQLEAHGLYWDETVRRQSRHIDEYESVLTDLKQRAGSYCCTCTRAMLAAQSRHGPDGPVYAGTCRDRGESSGALRLRLDEGPIRLDDPWHGTVERDFPRDVGDFVLRRADGSIGYQLACVVDEKAQGISEVVRGSDLIGSSLRQIHLQHLLNLPAPAYRHLPVLLDEQGRKLSKQNYAEPLDERNAQANLLLCLGLLGQKSAPRVGHPSVEELLDQAMHTWDSSLIPCANTLAQHQIDALRLV